MFYEKSNIQMRKLRIKDAHEPSGQLLALPLVFDKLSLIAFSTCSHVILWGFTRYLFPLPTFSVWP